MSAAEDVVLLRLGTQIAHARQQRGLTQSQLAEAIGIEARSMQRIESGRTAPSLVRLVDIGEVLGIPPGRLLDAALGLPTRKSGAPLSGKGQAQLAREEVTLPDRALRRVWDRLRPEQRELALKLLRVLASQGG